MSNTVETALLWAKKLLKNSECESYSLDAELFMMKVLDISRVKLFIDMDRKLSDSEFSSFKELVEKRSSGVPTQYILGSCEFMSLDFEVNPFTLIPRNDTEILVETAIESFEKNGTKTFIDIGTGSGCIAISLARYTGATCVAVDISQGAIETAKRNAYKNGVSEKINFVLSDCFENIDEKFDAIVSNPPYIKTDVIKGLMREVRDNEPYNALDGGSDGLYFYRKISNEAKNYLNEKGSIFFEIGYDQGEEVRDILLNEGFSDVRIIKDLAGLDRVVTGVKK